MTPKLLSHLFPWLIFLSLLLPFLYSIFPSHTTPPTPTCNLFKGQWVFDPTHTPLYNHTCPFHINNWNCLKNQRQNMALINSWKWVPESCALPRIDPAGFLGLMRNKNIGFVGDSLNENFVASLLCVLRLADMGTRMWKRKGASRGAYFPKFNVTVAHHRAVLLAKYEWQPKQYSTVGDQDGLKGIYRVDVDIPADSWVNITDFYDVLVFNTGHWWGHFKFPKETTLVFYRAGQPISPPLEILDGLKVVVENMVSFIQKQVPSKTLKFWRLQSPRHFFGGDWNHNGSCLFNEPLKESQLDLWFDPSNNYGVNKEARRLNHLLEEVLRGTEIQRLELTHLSEFRADAHPAIWLGKQDAVAISGQDCLHWCLPGLPDTWVDILSELIRYSLETRDEN